MNFIKYTFVILLAVVLAGCHSFTPPERPVAYIFPTVQDWSALQNLQAREIKSDVLKEALKKAGLLDELMAAGMLECDFDILVRGIRRHGYSELDARKTDLPFRWIAFCSDKGDSLILWVGFNDSPTPKLYVYTITELTK